MKVLIVGGGGREHALAWKISQSPKLEKLYCAPGNAGIADVADCVPIKSEDIDGIVAFAREKTIDLVIVGPEAPLVLGLVDRLEAEGIAVFGPTRAAAELEGSKGFMKDLCHKYNIPTGAYARFTDPDKARAYIRKQGAPIVVKADGIAAGKGVILCKTEQEALDAVTQIMEDRAFGDAGAEVVIEEFLEGEELSYFAVCDGKHVLFFGSAQDHKAAGDGDTGPNTGGMGAYTPAPVCTKQIERQIQQDVIEATITAMRQEGRPFRGVLFAGLMISDSPAGPEARVLEFNTRFGDPECQALMMRLKSDLLDLLDAAARGRLEGVAPEWDDRAALCVVMAAKGYPGAYEKGSVIRLPDKISEGVQVFHAGTARNETGDLVASGGRVLGVTALGMTVETAKNKAYQTVDRIDWDQGFCRRDIGWRAILKQVS